MTINGPVLLDDDGAVVGSVSKKYADLFGILFVVGGLEVRLEKGRSAIY